MYDRDILAEATADDGTEFRVSLVHDDGPGCRPRDDYSNAGMIYVIDQPGYIVPQEGDVPGLDAAIIDHDFRVVARWLRLYHGATVVLPLYDATGRDFNISAGTLDDSPRAGDYLGVTFDTPDTRRDVIGEGLIPAENETPTMARALAADVDTYARWAEGDVWGWVIETSPGAGDAARIFEDSCFGIIGREWAEEAAREELADAVAAYDADHPDLSGEIEDLRRTELGGVDPEAVPAR